MKIVHIYYTRFEQPLSSQKFQVYLETLPQYLQDKITRFVRWQDQHASLFARLLSNEALQTHQYNLQQIKYSQYQRPFVSSEIDFNLAHSGNYVVCAITESGRLGIDIERVRPIEIQHFKSILTPKQWDVVSQSTNYLLFFKFWTQKESVIKADGRGLQIALDQIEPVDNQVKLQQMWFLHEINMFLPDYACYLATDQQDIEINYQFRSFHD